MHFAPLVISICLHAAAILLVWFWPASPPVKLETPPIMISLVEGAPGGNMAPSPILGHMGEEAEGPLAPTPPAPQSEIAAHAREEVPVPKSLPVQEPKQKQIKPEPVAVAEKQPEPPKVEEKVPVPKQEPQKTETRPEPKPEPKQETKKPEPAPAPKKPEPPKPKKQETKPAPKPAPKKTARPDPVAAALQQARKATSRAQSGDRGNAVEQALAQAQRAAGGNRGGGGGQGTGPGGGGLGDVYIGQVMLAVRPNWGFASPGRKSLACVVRVNVDLQGNVQSAVVSQGSGNAQYDASAVNAIIRTSQAGEFPPPPNQDYTELDLVFTLDELMGR